MIITAKGFGNSHTKFGVLLSMLTGVMTVFQSWHSDFFSDRDVGACNF